MRAFERFDKQLCHLKTGFVEIGGKRRPHATGIQLAVPCQQIVDAVRRMASGDCVEGCLEIAFTRCFGVLFRNCMPMAL